MPFPIVLVLALAAQNPPHLPEDSTALLEILRRASWDLQDVEFICEGKSYAEGVDHKMDHISTYQSEFTYRRDGAARLDFYQKYEKEGGRIAHSITSVLNGTSHQAVPTLFPQSPKDLGEAKPGSVMGMSTPGSPVRFFSPSFWDWCLASRNLVARRVGSETLDGHECQVVEVDLMPGKGSVAPPVATFRAWVDLARSGNVIRWDFVKRGVTRHRVYPVELQKFSLARGKSVWFPVHAEYEFFPVENLIEKGGREVYDVVRGSLKFNQQLADNKFTTETKGHDARFPGSSNLKDRYASSLKAERGRMQAEVEASTPQGSLDERLREADRQAKELSASRASDDGLTTSISMIPAVLGAFGLLTSLIVWRVRSR